MEDFCKGQFWDNDLTWRAEDPDLTQCFKQTVLVWFPCFFLWIFTPLELHYIKRSRYSDIPWNWLNITKYIFLTLLTVLTVVDFIMIFVTREESKLPDSIIVAAALKIITFILIGVLQSLHKTHGVQSSGLMFLFWLALLGCGFFEYRGEFLTYETKVAIDDVKLWDQYFFISYMVYYPLVIIMFLLNCVSDANPRISTYKKYEKPSPEIHASFLRKMFFQWYDGMVWTGFRKALTEKDMYDINPDNSCAELGPVFDKYWEENVRKNQIKHQAKTTDEKDDKTPILTETTNGSIFLPLCKAFGGPFWFAGFLKFFLDLSQFLSPILMNAIMDYIQMDSILWKGIIYAFAIFLVTLFQTLGQGQYFYKTYLVGFRIRSALISAIYRKSMRISSKAKRDTTVGEIVNLMSVDAQRFFELVSYLHVLWSGPMVIVIAIVMLWQYLGVAVLAGLAVLICMIPLSGFIASKIRQYQITQMKIKDNRVKSMNEILNGIKVLKLYAWEPSFEKTILEVRDGEMVVLKKTAYFGAGTYFVWTMAPFLTTLASFICFVLISEEEFNAQTAFVSLALFNILRFPTAMFPMMITFVAQAWVSVQRINKFMNGEELDPNNVSHNPSDSALQIIKGTFTWGGEEHILKNINMRVKKKNLAAVVGPVGCGKSSLMSALLGEMEKTEGTVNTDGRIAYVPQQAWIQNCTLEQNITFGRPYNKALYDRVVDACALTADLAMLPAGDQTEIGEKGINLSGGQKQRVSLARAVYSDAEVYLFDDPLSAVDSHVAKHIFDNVIGETGLLKNKTRLLVTNAVTFLPRVDEIFVIKDGFITESGSYKELLEKKGAFSEFLIQFLQEVNDDEELKEIEESLGENNVKQFLERTVSTISGINNTQGGSPTGSLRKRDSKSSRRESSSVRRESAKKEIVEEIIHKPKAALMTKEESQTGSVSYKVYIRYFKSIGLLFGSLSFFLNAASQTLSILSSFWLTEWSSDPAANSDPAKRDMYMGVYGAYGVGQAVATLGTSVILAIACLNASRDLHNALLNRMFRYPMSFFDTTPLGRILNRFSKDVDTCDNTLPASMRFWLLMFFNVIGVFIVICIVLPIFSAVVLPLLILYYLIQKLYIATSRQLKRIESVTRSPIYSHFGESINGQSTIRAYSEQERFIRENEHKVDFNQLCFYPSIIANRWLAVRLELLGSLVVFFTAMFAIFSKDSLTPALAGLCITYSLQISQTLSMLVRQTADVETNIVSVERIDEYTKLPEEAPWKKGDVNPNWPEHGVVEFKDFQVRYREGLDLVLRGINFKVNSREKVGIVGRTGAGKSSLTLALFRIIESAGGRIIIDDIDVSQIGLHNLRSRLTIIPQDPVLFSDSLRMNLDPFKVYTDDAIWTALEHSHLKTFVKSLPSGLEHHITEGGENLSVGQRQLVCLARALLRKTKVLILDEATAAIDLETDELIQKTIRSEFSDCTILTIAHRLNTILDSDRVLVLDKGMIAEFDTPAALLDNRNSIFYGMAKKAGLVTSGIEDKLDDIDYIDKFID